MKRLVFLMVITVGFSAFSAEVDRRADHLQKRINQGVRSGELTKRETNRVERKEAHIQREIARDRADGNGLNNRERAKINRQENRLSHEVHEQKHDAQHQ